MIRSSDVISDATSNLILRVSCALSILGSLLVMLACSLPDSLRKKKGRQLIFWLSLTDFGTSVVYFLSSFETSTKNTDSCQTLALLGIFFPVASFLWTDFIALHIYMIITSRRLKTDKEWDRIMIYFHIISWGVGALCITLVAAFDHAGRNENDSSANTGGWCWVQTADPSMLIWWELIGGKFVEWTSCFLLLPFLYSSTGSTLVRLDRMNGTRDGSSNSTSFSISLFSSTRSNSRTTSGVSTDHEGGVASGAGAAALTREVHHGKFRKFYIKMVSRLLLSTVCVCELNGMDRKFDMYGSWSIYFPSSSLLFKCMHNMSAITSRNNSVLTWQALVPVLFFFARLWGSLRILLYAVSGEHSAASTAADNWLFLMQVGNDQTAIEPYLHSLIVFAFTTSCCVSITSQHALYKTTSSD
jgi:hypothetical protein